MNIYTVLSLALLGAVYNLVVFGVYAWDKRAARNGAWRVSEKTLLLLAFAGGGAGALWAQQRLRHKTRKPPFTFALPLFFVAQVIVALIAIAAPERFAELLDAIAAR